MQAINEATTGKSRVLRFAKSGRGKAVIIVVIAVISTSLLAVSRASSFSVSVEPELGGLGGCPKRVDDQPAASSGSYIQFCSASGQADGPGAHLPIDYNISSLTGTVRYVAINGSDSNAGTVDKPYATLSKAVSASAAGNTIVVRGGTYRDQRNISVGKNNLKIVAYPKETPIFNGSQETSNSSGWTSEGSYRHRSYIPRPLAYGGGVHFEIETDMTNLYGDGVGRYPDQVWIDKTPLKQVLGKSNLGNGKFYVDRSNNRIYLTTSDAAKSGIEISRPNPVSKDNPDRDRLFDIFASNVSIEGITITQYSATADDYGAITVESNGHDFKLKNVAISHLPYEGVHLAVGNNQSNFQNITMNNIGWQSINSDRTDNFTINLAKITDTDYFDEFKGSPASGALKTSRNRNTTVTNSIISDNKSQGLWFDQSNIDTVIANNIVQNNTNAGIFFEISDGLTMVNNYVSSSGGGQPAKLAGSSGLVLVNNTFVGGVDPVAVYTDPRSIPGCSTRPIGNACQINSDLQKQYPVPPTMDWMPRIDMFVNNIIAYPDGATYCGGAVPLCLHTKHSEGASAPIETIIHKADSARSIPQTIMDGNVYANGSNPIIRVSLPLAPYTTVLPWSTAMKEGPVKIGGIDANGRSGNSWISPDGSPTSALAAVHSSASPVPSSNAKVNKYIPAGTKHYGVLFK